MLVAFPTFCTFCLFSIKFFYHHHRRRSFVVVVMAKDTRRSDDDDGDDDDDDEHESQIYRLFRENGLFEEVDALDAFVTKVGVKSGFHSTNDGDDKVDDDDKNDRMESAMLSDEQLHANRAGVNSLWFPSLRAVNESKRRDRRRYPRTNFVRVFVHDFASCETKKEETHR